MTSRAVVLRADEERAIEVEFLDAPRCRGCEGSCLWRRVPGNRRARLSSARAFRTGDAVLVSLPARYVLLGALLLHGVPWGALLLGGLVGAWASGSDLGCLLGAGAGLALTLAVMPRLKGSLERATASALTLHPAP